MDRVDIYERIEQVQVLGAANAEQPLRADRDCSATTTSPL
jgi:hypothetical protein